MRGFLFFLLVGLVMFLNQRTLYGEERWLLLSKVEINATDALLLLETNVLMREPKNFDFGSLKLAFCDKDAFKEVSILWYDYFLDCLLIYHTPLCSGGDILFKSLTPGFISHWKRTILYSKLRGHKVGLCSEFIDKVKVKGYRVFEISPKDRTLLMTLKERDPLKSSAFKHSPSLLERIPLLLISLLMLAGLFSLWGRIPLLIRYFIILVTFLLILRVFL